jgi:hypothetical protein
LLFKKINVDMKKIIVCTILCWFWFLWSFPPRSTAIYPWDEEEDIEVLSLPAAMEQPVQQASDWAHGIEQQEAATPVSCLQKLACSCERNFHCSQCCTRMYAEPLGQRDWYYPCCFCAYDHIPLPDMARGCTMCNPCTMLMGENGVFMPDCCWRHTRCWYNGNCLDSTARERDIARWGCLLAIECFWLGWIVGAKF